LNGYIGRRETGQSFRRPSSFDALAAPGRRSNAKIASHFTEATNRFGGLLEHLPHVDICESGE